MQHIQEAARSSSSDVKTVFHARLHGRFIEKNKNFGRNKLHTTNQDTSFHRGGLGNGGNEVPLFNLEEKDLRSILKCILSNSIRYKCQRICSWSRGPETIMEIKKKRRHFSRSTCLLFRRNNTNRTIVFSHRPLPNILK